MRIKSNIKNNTSILVKGGQNITVPAGAILELEDSIYLKVEKRLAPLVKGGHLTIVKAVAKTDEQVAKEAAKALADAKALVAKTEADAKALVATKDGK